MAYSYTDLKPGTVFLKDGAPYKVLEFDFVRMQAQKPTVQLKLRNLLTGKVVQDSAQPSDNFEEAEIERTPVQFIYERNGEYWFHEASDKSKRFMLSSDVLGDTVLYMKSGTEISAQRFGGEIIGVELPIKVELVVKEAPPSIKGNTSSGGNKAVTLETGAKVNTPLFIESGDVIRVNTETGEYVERVKKG